MSVYSELQLIKRDWGTELTLIKDLTLGEYFIKKELIVDIELQKRLFDNEIKVHSSLDHKYIIRFHEVCSDKVFLMEYAGNRDLGSYLKAGRTHSEKLKLCRNFLMGLQYLHDKGLTHNDIKPSNILITADGRAKIGDFAFTAPAGERIMKDAPDYFIEGTQFFRPAEDSSSSFWFRDIYASALVIYLMFTEQNHPCDIDLQKIDDPSLRIVIQSALNGVCTNTGELLTAISSL